MWTQQVIFRNICVYAHTYTHAITISEKRGHEFEREKGGAYGRLRRRKGQREMFLLDYNLRNI